MPAGVAGFHQDSREIGRGAMFIALRTENRDGHDFLDDARSRGASCALVARHIEGSELPQLVTDEPLAALQRMAAAHRKRFRGPVIGVTGSCGKTSTKNLLADLLSFQGPVLKTEGNFNNHIGVPLTLLRLEPERHTIAVIEAGINMPGEMTILCEMIGPTHGVVTNVAPVHLEHLIDLDGVAEEKSGLLKSLPLRGIAAFPATCLAFEQFQSLESSVLVLESEDFMGAARRDLMRRWPSRLSDPGLAKYPRRVRYGRGWAERNAVLLVRFHGSDEETVFPVRSLSAGMAENAGLAIALAHELGAGDETIREALLRWEPGSYRGQVFSTDEGFYYLDCYNSNPVALVDAVEAFVRSAPDELPRLFVIGSMEELGSEADLFHFEALRSLRLRDGDFAFLIGTHARAMARGLADGGNDSGLWSVTETIDAVKERLKTFRGAVFVKGSRRYKLERLWVDLRGNAASGRGVAC